MVCFAAQYNARKIKEYFPLIEKAVKRGELSLPYTFVAKMQDRLLMVNDGEQIYGTQATALSMPDRKTEKKIYNGLHAQLKMLKM
ncbi:MAG TPA: hypothetical protein VMU83_16455 [Hanamia sp.]|nr:hypothetical protein [Hanamia sp.]